jgi:hypothetical protein
MGGEPLINPDYLTWLTNVAYLWPNAKIVIYTNGTQFHRQPELYNTIVELSRNRPGTILIIASIHDPSHNKDVLDFINQNFKNPKLNQQYLNQRQSPTQADIHIDELGVTIYIMQHHIFHQNSLIINPDQTASLHHSDPDKAYEICKMKPCHHMQDGKLYKCGPMGMLPYVADRFQINGRQEDLDLLYSYQPASTDWPVEKILAFVEELNEKKSIPQCGLCPEKFSYSQTDANKKKVFLLKKL